MSPRRRHPSPATGPGHWRAALLLLCLGCGPAAAQPVPQADPAPGACRMAYDLGSSGIRIGSNQHAQVLRAPLAALALQKTDAGLRGLLGPTIVALRDLQYALQHHHPPKPQPGALPAQLPLASASCTQSGGGFSAWRLAAETDQARLAELLGLIEQATGVGILVIPQAQEGVYGYVGSKQLLGERLHSSHVLDIGGGSLQLAGADRAIGVALGQKTWHARLCQTLRQAGAATCRLQPLRADELPLARALAQSQVRTPLQDRLHPSSTPVSMSAAVTSLTAVSRPVTLGIKPAIDRLLPEASGASTTAPPPAPHLQRRTLAQAIDRIADLDVDATARLTGAQPTHAAYLLSDMLLLEAILEATGLEQIAVEAIEITNVPGLLADEHVHAWRQRYSCYLERLQTLGTAAYGTDPGTCSP